MFLNTSIITFLLSSCFFFMFIFINEKKEAKDKLDIPGILTASLFISLVPTLLILVLLLLMTGSTNIVAILFDLHLTKQQISALAISFFVYILLFDSFFEELTKYAIGQNFPQKILMAIIRIFMFGMICTFFNIDNHSSLIISIGLAVLVLLMELTFPILKKNISN
ncbi:hypothetical protein WAK64_12425 [Bacillus spongiae]|uniref:Uncharacterized protein n=1 Tax=Bacillus spongiae TaxID=2683610 RepID=A0ABU8HEU3_9BACI